MNDSDLNRLHERIDDLGKRMDALTRELIESNRLACDRLTILETSRAACMAQCQRVANTVFGNGTEGLVIRTNKIEYGLKELAKDIAEFVSEGGKWKWLIIGGAVNLAIGVMTGVAVGWMLMASKASAG